MSMLFIPWIFHKKQNVMVTPKYWESIHRPDSYKFDQAMGEDIDQTNCIKSWVKVYELFKKIYRLYIGIQG